MEVALAFGTAEEFALMMLAFATFVGLGGDDIPKTLFSIFIGLALSAVGLDIISGEPRLIFGDLPGFFPWDQFSGPRHWYLRNRGNIVDD